MRSDDDQARRTILLLGNYRATVTLTRELGRAGYTVIVGCGGDEEGGAEFSRFCSRAWPHPPAEKRAEFLVVLRDFLARNPQVQFVLPASERYVRIIAEHGHELPADRVYATPNQDTVLTCLDKARTLDLANRAEVPVAPFCSVSDIVGLRASALELGFPLVIRPFDSMKRLFGLKAMLCGSEEDLSSLIPSWPAEHQSLLLQRKVSGLRHNVYFAASRGTPIRLLEASILRTDKPDGTGLAVEGVTTPLHPERREHTTRLLRALSYHGVGCAQFLVDPENGATHFLEINPRIAGHHAVAEQARLGLSRLAVALAAGDPVDEELFEGRSGMRYAWTFGEIRSLQARFRAGEVGVGGLAREMLGAIRTAIRADIHVSWDARDPMPTLRTYGRAVRSGQPFRSLWQFTFRPRGVAPDAVKGVSP